MKLSLLALIPLLVTAAPTDRDDGEEQRLAVFGADEEPVWLPVSALRAEKAKGRNYFDVTDSQEKAKNWRKGGKAAANKKGEKAQYPTPGHYKKKVDELGAKLDQAAMEAFLRKFSSYHTRYFQSAEGALAQKFLIEEVRKAASSAPNGRDAISVEEFAHIWSQGKGQNSIIARFPGDASRPRVILGAHLDSIVGDVSARSPGADDNGSGTVALLEAFKVIANSGWRFKAPLEFHWYAAEEPGLLGSQAVANSYEQAGVEVKGYMNLDMTAYVGDKADEHIAIVRDNVNPNLADFLFAAVNTYLDIPARDTHCGYACSDHGSWNRSGYPAAFPFEAEWGSTSPYIHTSNDTIEQPGFDWDHVKEFSKLAIAFAIELADK